MSVNYKIESYGNDTRTVLSRLEKERKELATKLEKVNISSEFPEMRTVYTGNYKLNDSNGCPASCVQEFTATSEVGFGRVEEEARRVSAGNLERYDCNLSAERYFELTEEQHKAITKPPVAGYIPERRSSLDNLFF